MPRSRSLRELTNHGNPSRNAAGACSARNRNGAARNGAVRNGAVLVVLAGALVRCDCEDIQFLPAATYMPAGVLDFGNVAVSTEKTLQLKVLSSGSAGLRILAANLENASDPGKWRVTVAEPLMTGLTPSRTSSITITYRPCPAAWSTVTITDPTTGQPRMIDQLKQSFDYNTCPGAPDSADLVTVEDGTRTGGARIVLSGQPVQPPVAEARCPRSTPVCNDPNAEVIECVGMNFGNVSAGQTPCDIVLEVQNEWRNDKPVGDLLIERVEITAQDINDAQAVTRQGEDIGFTVRSLDGSRLEVNAGNPLVVPIPDGQTRGSKRFLIRFEGTATGTWFGSQFRGDTGIRLYTSDPDKRVIKLNITGTGSAPDIEVFPPALNFGPVEQNRTKTLTASVSNAGDADLRINSISFRDDSTGAKFRYTTNRGAPPFTVAPTQRFAIQVHYTPPAPGQDSDALLINNNDPKTNNRVEVPISGGAVPRIRVDPNDTLVFPLPNPPPPPPTPPRTERVRVSNVGFGDLRIQRLEILGPSGDPTHPSVDDFSIMTCSANPCDVNVTLCPPSNPACSSSDVELVITYQNNDISTTDLAELHIRSSDPTDPDHVLVLSANDVPCLFPTPVITVVSPRDQLCAGRAISVSGSTSNAGGDGSTTMITNYNWSWLFTPAAAPPFSPNGTVNTTFMPPSGGLYIVGLDVTNDCGARSQSPASETINVADSCP